MAVVKRLLVALSVLAVILSFAFTASAHSGKTDSDGGHRDHINGGYHYHHGYGAHDHYDMDGDGDEDCPYEYDPKDNDSTKKQNVFSLILNIIFNVVIPIGLAFFAGGFIALIVTPIIEFPIELKSFLEILIFSVFFVITACLLLFALNGRLFNESVDLVLLMISVCVFVSFVISYFVLMRGFEKISILYILIVLFSTLIIVFEFYYLAQTLDAKRFFTTIIVCILIAILPSVAISSIAYKAFKQDGKPVVSQGLVCTYLTAFISLTTSIVFDAFSIM